VSIYKIQQRKKVRGKGGHVKKFTHNIKEEEEEEEDDECPPRGKALSANSVSALSLNDMSFGP
jgi:hypothetical protein